MSQEDREKLYKAKEPTCLLVECGNRTLFDFRLAERGIDTMRVKFISYNEVDNTLLYCYNRR